MKKQRLDNLELLNCTEQRKRRAAIHPNSYSFSVFLDLGRNRYHSWLAGSCHGDIPVVLVPARAGGPYTVTPVHIYRALYQVNPYPSALPQLNLI